MAAESFTLRFATREDIPMIVHHRRAMFEEMGVGTLESLDAQDALFGDWLPPMLDSGDYTGILAQSPGGDVVAGAGAWHYDWPPGPTDPLTRRICIMNVYTEPAYRGQGLARRLVAAIIDHAREQGLNTILLHASDAGRPIYESLGFAHTAEMRYAPGQEER